MITSLPLRLSARSDSGVREDIVALKAATDLRRYLKPRLRGYRELDGYWQANCLAPDHPDKSASLLIYPDQCRCQACSFRADILDFYRMEHPDVHLSEAIQHLLADPSLHFAGEVRRPQRDLDQDQATRYHLALAERPEALAGLEGMGFLRETIQHFRLGYAETLALLEPCELELAATAPRIVELEIQGSRVPYQRQMRYSVPVYAGGRVVQILYRKANPADLGPKITMEKGAGVHLFNVDALNGAELAVYCEGWGDAAIWRQVGVTAVTSTSGAGHFNQEWAATLGQVRRLYVVGDADRAGEGMAARFKKRFPWARLITLPPVPGAKDIRDLWLAGFRRRELLALLREADIRASWAAVR